MKVIGITGTLGAGKGAIVEYLKKKGFVHFSAREFLLEEVARRGLPPNRDSTTLVANDLRATHSPGYIIENLYKKAVEKGQDAVIESVRAIGELEYLRKQPNFQLFAVDADPKIRYARVTMRKSSLDNVSFEKFLLDEKREMSSKNPSFGSISDCIQQADFVFVNNSTKEELGIKVGEVLEKIMPK